MGRHPHPTAPPEAVPDTAGKGGTVNRQVEGAAVRAEGMEAVPKDVRRKVDPVRARVPPADATPPLLPIV
jgi:hypothetical protein